jgi:hypothetical protein
MTSAKLRWTATTAPTIRMPIDHPAGGSSWRDRAGVRLLMILYEDGRAERAYP